MKYGIKTDGDNILAISQFRDNVIPNGFQEISQDEYNNLIELFNPFQKWDASLKDMVEDTATKSAYEDTIAAEAVYLQMEVLKKDLEIAKDLETDMTELQLKYDQLKNDYKQLINK